MTKRLKKDEKIMIETNDHKGEVKKEMIVVHAATGTIVMIVIVAVAVIEDEAVAETEITEKPKRQEKKILRDKKIRKPKR